MYIQLAQLFSSPADTSRAYFASTLDNSLKLSHNWIYRRWRLIHRDRAHRSFFLRNAQRRYLNYTHNALRRTSVIDLVVLNITSYIEMLANIGTSPFNRRMKPRSRSTSNSCFTTKLRCAASYMVAIGTRDLDTEIATNVTSIIPDLRVFSKQTDFSIAW